MDKAEIEQLVKKLSINEKIGQLVQLTGDFFITNQDVIETGPMKKLGFDQEKFDLFDTGSVLNVVTPNDIEFVQRKYLEQSSHKIPLLFMADVIYGYKTIFPIPLAQTASWNFDLIERSAEIIAKECYEAGIHVTFASMVDIVRDPRWGRVLESPGEDTLIAKAYSNAMVKGLQGDKNFRQLADEKIAACVKHFAAYGAPRAGIEYGAVEMSEDSLWNYYLPSYQVAIDAGVKMVMTAFNTLNGVPCTGNQWLNKQVLRNNFEFSGVLIADYAAIEELKYHGYTQNDRESAEAAFLSTVDIDMKTSVYANNIADIVEQDSQLLQLLDDSVQRVLELKNDLGLFENPYRGLKNEKNSILCDEHRQLAQELAEESIVLLKNQNILPLKNEQKIALIGPYADEKSALGFWAITGDIADTITLKEGLDSLADENKWQISIAKGSNLIAANEVEKYGKYADNIIVQDSSPEKMIEEAVRVAQESDVIVLALGESVYQSGEAGSRVNPTIPQVQLDLFYQLKKLNKKIVLVVYAGRPLILTELVDQVEAIVYAWYPGVNGGQAVANILSGKKNPSGKLSITLPRAVGQIPIHYNLTSTAGKLIRQILTIVLHRAT